MPLTFSQGTEIQELLTDIVESAERVLVCGSYSINQDTLFFNQLDRRLRSRPVGQVYFLLPPFTEISRRNKNNVIQVLKHILDLKYDEQHAIYLGKTDNTVSRKQVRKLVRKAATAISEAIMEETAKRFQKELRLLEWMRQRNITYLFQPLFHAKFIYSDQGGYEGSANFTPSGIIYNIEVYRQLESNELGIVKRDLNLFLKLMEKTNTMFENAAAEEEYYFNFELDASEMADIYSDFLALRHNLWHSDGDLIYKLAVDFHLVRIMMAVYPFSYRGGKPTAKLKRSILKDVNSLWLLANLRQQWPLKVFYPFLDNKNNFKKLFTKEGL